MEDWIGSRVRVVRGPFADFFGTVVDHRDDCLVVDVEIYGRTTPVLFPPEDLRRGGESGGGAGGAREPREPSSPSSGEQAAAALDG